MRHKNVLVLSAALLLGALGAAPTPIVAAEERSVSPRYRIPTFHLLIHNSGYIFGGTVKSVERSRNNPQSIAIMRITFHVENAIRGVRRGQTLIISEWAGLWESGEHYRVGEHVVLFLFRPGKLGLTSPVGGPLGKFRVDRYGRVQLTANQAAAIASEPDIANPNTGGKAISLKKFSGGIRRALQGRALQD